MQWASSVTEENEFGHAVAVAAAEVSRQLSAPPDLVICFVSAHHEERYEALPELLSEWFPGSIQFGCSGGGIIGGGQEVEQGAGLSLTAACLPGVEITPFHIEQHYIPDLYASTSAWKEMVGIAAGETADFLLIAEPFSFETEPFLMLADRAFPAAAKAHTRDLIVETFRVFDLVVFDPMTSARTEDRTDAWRSLTSGFGLGLVFGIALALLAGHIRRRPKAMGRS